MATLNEERVPSRPFGRLGLVSIVEKRGAENRCYLQAVREGQDPDGDRRPTDDVQLKQSLRRGNVLEHFTIRCYVCDELADRSSAFFAMMRIHLGLRPSPLTGDANPEREC